MQVCDLLIYNSGFGLGVGDLMLWLELNVFICVDIIVGLVYLKLVSSFCSCYVYDNLMYVVVGEVVVVVGGKLYDQLMCEQVFELLGMICCQVGVWLVKWVGNVVQLYVWCGDCNVVVNVDGVISLDLFLMVVGGICCLLCDMMCWMQVLFDFMFVFGWLDVEQCCMLWILYMLMVLGECQWCWDNVYFYGYGYGWWVLDMDGQWKVVYIGILLGMYLLLVLLFDCKVGVVMLINGEGEDVCIVLMQVVLKCFIVFDEVCLVLVYLVELRVDQVMCVVSGYQWLVMLEVWLILDVDLLCWQGCYIDLWLGLVLFCLGKDGLCFSVDKLFWLQGVVWQLQGCWLLCWDMLGEDVQVWLQFGEGYVLILDLCVIDLDIDFSYDFQDLYFICIGDCFGGDYLCC